MQHAQARCSAPSARDAERRGDAASRCRRKGRAPRRAGAASGSTCSRMRRGDALDLGVGVDARARRRRTAASRDAVGRCVFIPQPPVTSASIRRRLILPVSVLGSASRNSTSFGTMKSSRCCAQWRMMSRSVSVGARRERDHRLDREAEDRVGRRRSTAASRDAGQRVEHVLDFLRARPSRRAS